MSSQLFFRAKFRKECYNVIAREPQVGVWLGNKIRLHRGARGRSKVYVRGNLAEKPYKLQLFGGSNPSVRFM